MKKLFIKLLFWAGIGETVHHYFPQIRAYVAKHVMLPKISFSTRPVRSLKSHRPKHKHKTRSLTLKHK